MIKCLQTPGSLHRAYQEQRHAMLALDSGHRHTFEVALPDLPERRPLDDLRSSK
jgi:hypothetical protein